MLYEMLLLFAVCGTVTPQYLYNVIFPTGNYLEKYVLQGCTTFKKIWE